MAIVARRWPPPRSARRSPIYDDRQPGEPRATVGRSDDMLEDPDHHVARGRQPSRRCSRGDGGRPADHDPARVGARARCFAAAPTRSSSRATTHVLEGVDVTGGSFALHLPPRATTCSCATCVVHDCPRTASSAPTTTRRRSRSNTSRSTTPATATANTRSTWPPTRRPTRARCSACSTATCTTPPAATPSRPAPSATRSTTTGSRARRSYHELELIGRFAAGQLLWLAAKKRTELLPAPSYGGFSGSIPSEASDASRASRSSTSMAMWP